MARTCVVANCTTLGHDKTRQKRRQKPSVSASFLPMASAEASARSVCQRFSGLIRTSAGPAPLLPALAHDVSTTPPRHAGRSRTPGSVDAPETSFCPGYVLVSRPRRQGKLLPQLRLIKRLAVYSSQILNDTFPSNPHLQIVNCRPKRPALD